MPNIIQQVVGDLTPVGHAGVTGIFIKSSNGKTVTLTKAQIIAEFTTASGSTAQKKTTTLMWIKQQIETALGVDQVPQGNIASVDINTADGTPTALGISS